MMEDEAISVVEANATVSAGVIEAIIDV